MHLRHFSIVVQYRFDSCYQKYQSNLRVPIKKKQNNEINAQNSPKDFFKATNNLEINSNDSLKLSTFADTRNGNSNNNNEMQARELPRGVSVETILSGRFDVVLSSERNQRDLN